MTSLKKNLLKLLSSLSGNLQAIYYLFNHSNLFLLLLLPIVINILLFPLLVLGILLSLNGITNKLLAQIQLSNFELTTIHILLIFAAVILTIYLFNSIALAINAPFYNQLTIRVMQEKGLLIRARKPGIKQILNDIFYSLGFEGKKLVISILIFLITSLLNFIPGIGTVVFVVINIIILIFFNGINLFEPCFYQRHLDFKAKVKIVLTSPLTIWPHAFISGLLNSIPLVNLITIPITVLGAILVFSRD